MKFELCTPMLGFEDIQEVELKKVDDIFMNMKAVSTKDISFTLINPFVLREYKFDIPSATQELLGIKENSNVLILNIVLIQTPIEESAINFISPFIFNVDTAKASQIILPDDNSYGITEKISSFLDKK